MEDLNYKAFRQVGIVIETRLCRYVGSRDEFGRELYKIYSHIRECWLDIGHEKGYFKRKAGVGKPERKRGYAHTSAVTATELGKDNKVSSVTELTGLRYGKGR